MHSGLHKKKIDGRLPDLACFWIEDPSLRIEIEDRLHILN